MLRLAGGVAGLLLTFALMAPAWAAANQPFELKGKAGVSNFRISVTFQKDGIKCTPGLLKELKVHVMDVGLAAIVASLPTLREESGTDASKSNEFFLIRYEAVCTGSGGIVFVNAAEDPYDNMNVYDPGRRQWQCANRAGEDCSR